MRQLFAVILFCLTATALPACDDASSSSSVSKTDRGRVVDYDNGVFYFAAIEATFANTLSAFLAAHPELEVAAVAGDGNGVYGRDTGYFVIFRRKN